MNDLQILNDFDADFPYVQDNRKGRPDLTISGINISDKLNSWTAHTNNFSYSDQRYISYDVNYNPAEQMLFHYKTKNKSFFNFNNHLKTRVEELITLSVVDCKQFKSIGALVL